ncbi:MULTISPECIES: hypothetical protein [unclassified Sporosarcina]|nr:MULTISPECIES: hypothetical protein [unclassified Sporosarcina]
MVVVDAAYERSRRANERVRCRYERLTGLLIAWRKSKIGCVVMMSA